MRWALRLLLLVTLALALVAVVMPTPSLAAASAKTDCCAAMDIAGVHYDCDGHAPKSQQDRQCCPVCALCLSLFLTSTQKFVFPPANAETLTAFNNSGTARFDRPLTPPPRRALS